jgi:hypothetical protein
MTILGYCIVDLEKSVPEQVEGVEDQPIDWVSYGSVGMVITPVNVAPAELRRAAQRKKHNGHPNPALVYDKVVNLQNESTTVLPLQFPTLFPDREAAEETLERQYHHFRERLDELQGRVEYGIKVMWNGERRKEEMLREAKMSSYVEHAVLSGKSFLQKRYALHKRDMQLQQEARQLIADLHSFIEPIVDELHYQYLLSDNYLLNGSYLVRIADRERYEAAVDRMQAEFPELNFMVSGPVAPYHFVDLDLEN